MIILYIFVFKKSSTPLIIKTPSLRKVFYFNDDVQQKNVAKVQ